MRASDDSQPQLSGKAGPNAAAPGITVSVIGGISVRAGSEPVRLTNQKARALVAYLAMSDADNHDRERLAGLLWGENNESHARNSLRRALFDLRAAFQEVAFDGLVSGRRAVELDKDSFRLDTVEILRSVAANEVPEAILNSPRIDQLILAGHDELSPLFDEWVISARQRFADQLLRALETAYQSTTLPRLLRRRMAAAAFLLDPANEAACRAIMRLAAENGEIGVALQAYADLYAHLDNELDMEPSVQTVELVAQIKQGEVSGEDEGEAVPAIVPLAPRAITINEPTVAILPFRSLGSDTVPDYFAEAVVEDTVRTLATLREPVVISSNSTRHLQGASAPMHEIGQVLGARYLVTGTVRQFNEDLRLSVELAEAESGRVLWAEAFDTTEPLLFRTQDRIARSIAGFLVPRMRDAELQSSRRLTPEDLTAYQLMLRGQELAFQLEREAFEVAGGLLRRSIEVDPYFALSHAALADWHSIRLGQGWSDDPENDTKLIEEMARKAIALDSSVGRAAAMLGHNHTILQRNYDEAISMFDWALDACPNDAEALMWSSPTYSFLGDTEEAIRRAERAIGLSPQDPFLFRYEHFLAIGHYAAGSYAEAADWGRRSLEHNPNYSSNLRTTIAALVGLNELDEARSLARKVSDIQPGFRVAPLIANHAFRDPDMRQRYAEHLMEAGLEY